ncbi:hypothetical protein BJX65DRAFT_303752 [Aspergillus insuetus]
MFLGGLNYSRLSADGSGENRVPDDPQTLDDYGFSRCEMWNQRSHLLGLYTGLLNVLQVSPRTLDKWRRDRSLVKNIIARFERLPPDNRGAYFPWFLKHTELLDHKLPLKNTGQLDFLECIKEARTCLAPADRELHFDDMQPVTKRKAFLAFACFLRPALPHPSWIAEGTDQDIWYDLGFGVCRDEDEENALVKVYGVLVGGHKSRVDYYRSLGIAADRGPRPSPAAGLFHTRGFEDFHLAYESGTLVKLMDSQGLRESRSKFRHLETFLGAPSILTRPSVWRLRQLLILQHMNIAMPNHDGLREAASHYRLGHSWSINAKSRLSLADLYDKIWRRGDPMDLHNARLQGTVLDYAKSIVKDIDPGLIPILQSLPRT